MRLKYCTRGVRRVCARETGHGSAHERAMPKLSGQQGGHKAPTGREGGDRVHVPPRYPPTLPPSTRAHTHTPPTLTIKIHSFRLYDSNALCTPRPYVLPRPRPPLHGQRPPCSICPQVGRRDALTVLPSAAAASSVTPRCPTKIWSVTTYHTCAVSGWAPRNRRHAAAGRQARGGSGGSTVLPSRTHLGTARSSH